MSLKDYGSGLATGISKSDDRFIRVRSIFAVINKGWIGFHEPAFLDIETKVREDRFARGLQCRDNLAVLKFEQYSAHMDLQFQLLVPDSDRFPHGMRIGESFGGSVGNGCGKAWPVQDHAPYTGNITEGIEQAFSSLGIE
jgi:hypothetical protein